MVFETALSKLRLGYAARRTAWKNVATIRLQMPDTNSKMTLPYIYAALPDGNLVPWLASQTDLLANDWEIIRG